MNERWRWIFGAFSLVVVALACSKRDPAEQTKTAPEAPVTAGYEAAIAAHAMKPIFRPSGIAPAMWGPGDRYNLLATGEETNNKAGDFVFVPRGTVHRFKNVGSTESLQLVTFVPAGMEGYFRAAFQSVTDPKAAHHRLPMS